MGNTESQPALSDTVVSSLPKRTQQRLSQVHTPAKKHQPSSFSFFEAAAVTQTPAPKAPIRPSSRKSSSAAASQSSSSKSSIDKRTLKSPLSSIRASVISFPEIHQLKLTYSDIAGRRYLTTPGTHYHLPCDDDETDRLVILHFLLKYAFKGNVIAPIIPKLKQSKAQILDIGCGGGTWVLEMANDYPSAECYGIDIFSNFPKSVKPTNAHFSQHNFLSSLPFPDNSLDYIHMRSLLCVLSPAQLQTILGEISRVLKPLGTVEIMDIEQRIQRPGPLSQALLNDELHNAFHRNHINLLNCHQLSTLLMNQSSNYGFVDINQQQVTIPLGWGGQVGQVHAQCTEAFYKSLSPTIRNAVNNISPPPTWQPTSLDYMMGLSDPAVEQAMNECGRYQSHMNWFVCYAQKSLIPSSALSSPRVLSSKSSSMAPSITSTIEVLPTNHKLANPIYESNWETINHFVDGFTD
ncbi:S-adenosyl-L-methionine-dependent methyltransferase [Chlamydoabsidia padenii]|nr:S-adenosyl-L-methionine-dependent methyltransferase [Chlamydoabsidia padenii]